MRGNIRTEVRQFNIGVRDHLDLRDFKRMRGPLSSLGVPVSWIERATGRFSVERGLGQKG